MDLAIHVFLFDTIMHFHEALPWCVTFAAKRQVDKRLDQAVLMAAYRTSGMLIFYEFSWFCQKKFIVLSHKFYDFNLGCRRIAVLRV